MSDFVRVKLPNGAEASVPASHAESRGYKPLNKPAMKNGRVLRDKPKVSVPKPSSSTTNPSGSGSSAASTQEDSK